MVGSIPTRSGQPMQHVARIPHLYAAINGHGNKGIDSVDCLYEIDQLGLATHYITYVCAAI